jgi:2-methylisocitrate lyase-like PEP mutase family enzyme
VVNQPQSSGKPNLRGLLAEPGAITCPGVYDGISARIADRLGFRALYLTGYGTVASSLGLPDAGLASYTEMLERVRMVAGAITAPLIADADTGYGGLLNVERTVRGYERAGAAALQLEDQASPKKCGHTEGRIVIPADEAARKIRVAAATRDTRDFLIVARTDARTTHGLDEALHRADLYLAAGADILFVESPESVEELRRIGERFAGAYLLANMVEGGRTPYLATQELATLGFKIGLYPTTGFLAAAAALQAGYAHLQTQGSASNAPVPLLPFAEMNELMGFPDVYAFQRRWQ